MAGHGISLYLSSVNPWGKRKLFTLGFKLNPILLFLAAWLMCSAMKPALWKACTAWELREFPYTISWSWTSSHQILTMLWTSEALPFQWVWVLIEIFDLLLSLSQQSALKPQCSKKHNKVIISTFKKSLISYLYSSQYSVWCENILVSDQSRRIVNQLNAFPFS